MTRNVCLFVTM